MALRRAAALLTFVTTADAHGALVSPPPRNAIDKDLAPWSGGVPAHPPAVESKTGWCPVPGEDGKASGQNGQACFCAPALASPSPQPCLSEGPTNSRWLTCLLHCAALPAGFSNGCAIGCKTCDGFSRGPIPWGSFKKDPFWDRKFNLCPVGAANSTQVAGKPTATICDPNLRTINTHGADVPNGRNRCGGPDDWYYYSPWRAPGKKQFQHVIDDFLWFSAEFH